MQMMIPEVPVTFINAFVNQGIKKTLGMHGLVKNSMHLHWLKIVTAHYACVKPINSLPTSRKGTTTLRNTLRVAVRTPLIL